MSVLISDRLAPECAEILKQAGIQVDTKTGLSPEELIACIGDYEGLIVRSATKATPGLIEAATQLKVIGRAGAGVDNIDTAAATRRGVLVMNTPGGNTISTAEHAFSMLLALSRNIPQASASLKAGRWDPKKYTGVEVHGKTLGIIGMGKVGREMALRARAFGMTVLGFDPFLSTDAAAKMGVEMVSLDEMWPLVDYISIHAPLTGETRHLLSDEQFARCRKGVRLIHCARGGIVDEGALLRAIEKGQVKGAALDVFESEPPDNLELLAREEVICTPHLGASTEEAQVAVAIQIAEQIADFLKTGAVRNSINLPPMERSVYQKIRYYIELGEKIGRLQGQLSKGKLTGVSIEYRGDFLDYPISPITSAVLTGILSRSSDMPINFVNALVIAREWGIKVDEIRSSEHEDYSNLVTIQCTTDREERVVAGTLFGKNDPRIVRINEYHCEAPPQGDMLICGNKDVPGVIGRIGSLLGENGINIARMSWGREKAGGKAITVLNLDSPVPDATLADILAHENILWAERVKL
ncbi:MAG: phosphoglycerate dehydrogenase [Candidatus Latescibacterota bacterium]